MIRIEKYPSKPEVSDMKQKNHDGIWTEESPESKNPRPGTLLIPAREPPRAAETSTHTVVHHVVAPVSPHPS